ncbi:hypothetical protein J1N35_009795 [Gossypium stocksii]|uniref:Uncharacterized protein n=1 Tax=Gossypium stocksii TaxID=47602 RepID=A0A9D3VZS1_9ROSI|nr:hypothetical protein J1N35_009795 [Gossypium stocksii]
MRPMESLPLFNWCLGGVLNESSFKLKADLALEDRVVTLEESMGDVKERIDDVDDRLIDGLQTMKEQLREYVWDTIGSSENKLAEKNDALEAMVTALKEEISELKGSSRFSRLP